MKNFILTGITLLSITTSMADTIGWGNPGGGMGRGGDGRGRGDGRMDPLPPAPPMPPRPRDDELRRCIDDLNRSRFDLQRCLDSRVDDRELSRLRFENEQLRRENQMLRDQLDRRDPLPPFPAPGPGPFPPGPGRGFGVFSYAGCLDFRNAVDLKFIASGEGAFQLEAETNAKQKVASAFSCSYGIGLVKSEEIRSSSQMNYCVAGCVDYRGNIDQKFIQSGRGRNQTEAEFNAIKAVGANFSCSYGIKIQSCN